MKNVKYQALLLGIRIVGAGIGFSHDASAQPRANARAAKQDVKAARQDVKQERKDVKQANTPYQRRDAKQDLRGAKQDLQQEKRDLNHTQARVPNRPVYTPPIYSRPVPNRPAYNRPVNNRPVNNRPTYNQPTYNRPVSQNQALHTLEGVVTNNTAGNDFNLRISNGQQVRAYAQNGEPGGLSQSDTVRVYGYSSNGVFYVQNISIIRNR